MLVGIIPNPYTERRCGNGKPKEKYTDEVLRYGRRKAADRREDEAASHKAVLFLCGLYSANIVLIVSYLLIIQSIIRYKNQKHFNQFTMSLLFCVILFYMIFLPLYLPLSEFVNTDGTI